MVSGSCCALLLPVPPDADALLEPDALLWEEAGVLPQPVSPAPTAAAVSRPDPHRNERREIFFIVILPHHLPSIAVFHFTTDFSPIQAQYRNFIYKKAKILFRFFSKAQQFPALVRRGRPPPRKIFQFLSQMRCFYKIFHLSAPQMNSVQVSRFNFSCQGHNRPCAFPAKVLSLKWFDLPYSVRENAAAQLFCCRVKQQPLQKTPPIHKLRGVKS